MRNSTRHCIDSTGCEALKKVCSKLIMHSGFNHHRSKRRQRKMCMHAKIMLLCFHIYVLFSNAKEKSSLDRSSVDMQDMASHLVVAGIKAGGWFKLLSVSVFHPVAQ